MIQSVFTRAQMPVYALLPAMTGAAALASPALAQGTAPVVAVQVNQSAFTPGQALRLSASVTNPGGGPVADFYVGIQLPDGVSTVSVRLGAGPVGGSLAHLAALAPTAAGVVLALPFTITDTPLLSYTFTGVEPVGTYVAYIAAIAAGGLRDGALGPGELLAFNSVTFSFGAGGIVLTGAPASPALQATTAYHGSTGVPDTAISTDGAGRRIARTQIEVKFRADATVGQVNAALASMNGRIVSMLPGVLILLVEIPDPGSLAALEALTTRLGQAPGVVAVIQQDFPDLATLPPNVSLISSDLDKIDHLLASRTHAAWNTEAALRRSGTVRPLLVLGDAFGLTQPGAPFDVATLAGDYANTTYSQHGYHVLGTIAATFGGDTTEAGLATGLLPGTTAVRAVDLRDNNPTAGDFQNRMLTHVRNHTGNVVLNTSLQFSCTTAAEVAANCVTAPAQLKGSIWLEKVRGTAAVTVQGAGLEGRFLHAAAAGNVTVSGDLDARTGTAYAAAALIAGMTDANGAAVPNAINTLVVENQLNTPGPYLPSCLASGSKRVLTRTASTNLVNISAIGTDVFNLRAPTIAAGNLSGTSMATPQVAALALWVWTLRPNLTNRQVMQIITSSAETAVSPLADSRCDQVSTPGPSIDVYAAVLATDTALTDAPVRLALFDVADANGNAGANGRFDDQDIVHILREFAAAGGALDFSRYDLNGDGETGGTGGARFDLDFDRVFQVAERVTEGLRRTVNEAAATDLDILCHFGYTSLYSGDRALRDATLGSACGLTTLVVTSSQMEAIADAELPTRPRVEVADVKSQFAATQSVTATNSEQVTVGGATVRAATTSTATRSVTTAGAGTVITGTFRHDPGLTAEPPVPGFNSTTNALSNQAVCFSLPGPFLATYSVQSSAQGDPSIFHGATLRLQSGVTERFAEGGESGSIVLPASPSACISFSGYPWACRLDFAGRPVCDRPAGGTAGPLTGGYTVTLVPVP
jgi:Subtilase family